MSSGPAAERARALGRVGLISALVGGWCVYAYRISPPSVAAALRATLAEKAPTPARGPSSASVSWVKGGAPLDAATLESLKKEAEAGVTGPAISNFIESARKRGDLDKAALPNGMTYAQMLRRAEQLAAEANAKPHDLGLDDAERKPGDDDPAVVVPMLIEQLRSPQADVRGYAAMLMIDNRWAKWERAGEAVPALEAIAANKGEEGAEFAELSLKRIRFWEAKRRFTESAR